MSDDQVLVGYLLTVCSILYAPRPQTVEVDCIGWTALEAEGSTRED